jgi:acyl-CoA synthetase (NDP forming)
MTRGTNQEGQEVRAIFSKARERRQRSLNEFESKKLLAAYGIPVSQETFALSSDEASRQAKSIGYPVALKACGAELTHKTELGGVSLNLRSAKEVRKEGERLLSLEGCEGLLVQEMVKGHRELVAGMTRDARFGPCIMFGLGGTLTEVLRDVVFRLAPLTPKDAREMIEEIRGKKILERFRGESPVDVNGLMQILIALGKIGTESEEVLQIDVNPLKIRPDGRPVAVDALVVLSEQAGERAEPIESESRREKTGENWTRLFEPRSVAVVGASSMPGKPGYDVVRNILANQYEGRLYLVNPKGGEILGLQAHRTIADLPEGIDLGIIIVSADKSPQAVRECVAKGMRHFVMAAGGFAEYDQGGAEIQRELVSIIREKDLHVLGPNTSGNVSTPHKFTSTFFPLGKIRRGSISYIAQTGNFATHTMKYILSGEHFGVARVVGLGNAIDTDECDALEYLENDPETKSILMYLEHVKRPRRFLEIAQRVTLKKPVVMLKGGATEAGKKAAVAHTASMALEDHLVDGLLKQAGIARIPDYTQLVHVGKALAMSSLPKGNRVGFLAPSGAMLVVLSDLCTRLGLDVPALQPESVQRLQEISPPFILMRNPVDIWASATTKGIEFAYREGMEVLLRDPNIDAVVPILLLTKDTGIPSYDFIIELTKKYKEKPILITFSGEAECIRECKSYLEPLGVPTFAEIEHPFHVLSIVYRCRKSMDRPTIE